MKRYVIGDVHGCYDELYTLLDMIDKHSGDEEGKLIFVGDYVDRGPDSKKVVDLVMHMQKNGHVALMGNHEDMLLSYDWRYAAETLNSFSNTIPDYVMEWMSKLPKYYEDDTIIVAHAGIDPNVALVEQTDSMLLWHRYPAGSGAWMDRHFYHGHTPSLNKNPEGGPGRTNVDTGCVYGGYLTAAIVGDDGKPEGFIQVPAKIEQVQTNN